MKTSVRQATSADWPAIKQLLKSMDLPLDGARDHLDGFVVAEKDGAIVGCAALEKYPRVALLRSVAVDSSLRGRRIGEEMVSDLIARARRDGIQSLFLLTITAANWFPRFGFVQVDRAAAPEELSKSEEFRGACPESSVLMSLALS